MERTRDESRLKSQWLLVIGAALIALAMVACGGSNDASNSNTPTASTPQGSAQPSDMAPADQQVLHLRISQEPATLDPQLSSLQVESTINKQLFTGLFTYDDKLNVVPALAKEMPTVENGGISADGTTYTIKLADNAEWSDGKPLTAADFVYSMKRALDPTLGSPYVTFFYSIDGAQAYNTAMGTKDNPKTPSADELSQLRDAVGVSAPDDHTIVYHLVQPTPSFLNYLALWTAYPVRQDVIEQWGAQWTEPEHNVGDGPFVLAEWDHNQKLVLKPNPNFIGEKPLLSSIEVNIIADDATAYAAYMAGELDETSVPISALHDVQSASSPYHDQLIEVPGLNTFGLFMNNAMPPFDNIDVRKAFAMAIDRDALVEGVLQGAGLATTTWIAPGEPGYDVNSGTDLAFDASAAQAELAKAGYPDGAGLPEVTFLAVDQPMARVLGQFVEDQLKQNLNVNVKTEYLDGPTYGGRFTSNQAQATVIQWNADWPYPDNWLPSLFSSNSPNNHIGYDNSSFDDLVLKAGAETDNTTRLDLYDQAQTQLLQDAAISPLFNLAQPVLVKPWVKGLTPTGLDGEIKGDYSLFKTYIASH